jgi:hypothetical protein
MAETPAPQYELYRKSTLGECLTEALEELGSKELITEELQHRVLTQFDIVIPLLYLFNCFQRPSMRP